MFPGAQRMNRGNHEVGSLVKACRANDVTDLVVIHETRGQPGRAPTPHPGPVMGRTCIKYTLRGPASLHTYSGHFADTFIQSDLQ